MAYDLLRGPSTTAVYMSCQLFISIDSCLSVHAPCIQHLFVAVIWYLAGYTRQLSRVKYYLTIAYTNKIAFQSNTGHPRTAYLYRVRQ